MAYKEYTEIMLPKSWVVFGIKLKPLSLGHYILLDSIKSPFITDGIPDWNHIKFVLMICSNSYSVSKDLINDFDKISEWQLHLQKAFKKEKDDDKLKEYIFEATKTLTDYFNESFTQPIFVNEKEEGEVSIRESGTSWIQNHLMIATSKLNYTRDEALNCPISQLIADVTWHYEYEGCITVLPKEIAETL